MPGEKRRARLRALLKLSGAADVPVEAIERAFVHESASREGAGPSNERLEFAGDAVLGYVTARWLVREHPDAPEGELARRKAALVSGDACAASARRLGFADVIVLGSGMASAGGADNTTILADAFEAYLAALHDAAGLDVVARFIEDEHLAHVAAAVSGERDAKTALQEFTQGRLGIAPVYFERAEGPPHDRRFTSQVRIGDEILGEGIGPSKKAAQQSAAAMALAVLEERGTPPSGPDSGPPGAPTPPPSNGGGRVIAMRRRSTPEPTGKAPT